jgi:uncharacterized protein (TIGR02118 family)
MVKVTILFKQPADETTFETRYNANLALMEQLPGLQRRQACFVLGSPAGRSPYYRILELYFEDAAAMDAALRSPEGVKAGADLVAFMGQNAEVIFAEVFEE